LEGATLPRHAYLGEQEDFVKTTALSTLLSVISLIAVGVLYVKVDDMSDELRLARSGRADVDRETAADSRSSDRAPYYASNHATRPVSHASNRSDPVADDDEGEIERPATVEERLARLERKAKQERRNPMSMWQAPKFARNLDDLSDQLKLTRTQRDRVDQAIQRGKDRIDAVMSIPGADGKSPKQAREERMKKLLSARKDPNKNHGQILNLAMGGLGRMNEEVPGSNETYADQVKRIKTETRDEVNSNLSPEQQEDFKGTNIDGMMGAPGGSAVSVFMTTPTSDGDDGDNSGGSIIVESGGEIAVDVEDDDG